MKKLLLLFWLLPAYLGFLTAYETRTYVGLTSTYADGASLVAQIVELKLKNMQAQSNGIIEIRFTDEQGAKKQQKMTLPIQLAAQLQPYNMIPIRYLESSSTQVVFMPTYEFHKNMVLMNIAITLASLLITLWIGFRISKYAFKPTESEKMQAAVEQAWAQLKTE